MSIRVETRFQPPQEDGIPAIALQVTCLLNSYMIWAGATGDEDAQTAVNAGRLVADWACAMPPISDGDASATPLFRSSNSDAALSMSQRLARRFKKQVFLSIDVPVTPASSALGARVMLDIEKLLVKTVKEMEAK
ncbi:hypothetical protein PENSPDRAFT_626008 [Peniophora sp. CONT]|nr:hypothetical protein PENSPDRAFT_626008 [Peniophora sp. CONT]